MALPSPEGVAAARACTRSRKAFMRTCAGDKVSADALTLSGEIPPDPPCVWRARAPERLARAERPRDFSKLRRSGPSDANRLSSAKDCHDRSGIAAD